MSLRKAWFILPFAAAVAALVAVLVIRGKGAGKDVVSNGAAEAEASEEALLREHYAKLDGMRKERVPIASERAKAVKAMEAIIAQAKNALAAEGVENPSDDQLKAEIDGHPDKYPEWKELYAKVERLNREFSAKSTEMQAEVRRHMLRTGAHVPGVPQKKN